MYKCTNVQMYKCINVPTRCRPGRGVGRDERTGQGKTWRVRTVGGPNARENCAGEGEFKEDSLKDRVRVSGREKEEEEKAFSSQLSWPVGEMKLSSGPVIGL